MNTKHTPTPWDIDTDTSEAGPLIYSNDKPDPVAQVYGNHDAEFIVRACNSHDDLVAALEEAADYVGDDSRSARRRAACLESWSALLAKAKGE